MRDHRAGLAVIALGSLIVAVVSLALVSSDHGLPTSSASTSPSGAVAGSSAPNEVTSRLFHDFALPATVTADPLGPTLQTPVWRAGGRWWAALRDPARDDTRIFRLTADGSAWEDRRIVVDERPGAIVDTVWAAPHLYVASVVPDRATTSGVRLTRLTFDAASGYHRDPDFPVRFTERGTKSLSLARDSGGILWIAFVQDGVLKVSHSSVNDVIWSAPLDVETAANGVGPDDLAALVAFGTGRIGVAWTDNAGNAVRFAWRGQGDPPDRWSAEETVSKGLGLSRDPLSVTSDADGSVLVSIAGDATVSSARSQTAPRLLVARREPSGGWSSALAGRAEDRHGPAVLTIDPDRSGLVLVSVSPDRGGSLHVKRSALSRLEFAAGLGTLIGPEVTEGSINLSGPKIPKETPEAGSELLVLAFDALTRTYEHALIRVGSGAAPTESGSPGPSASSGPSGPPGSVAPSPSPGQAVPAPIPYLDDTFDPARIGTALPGGWALRPGDPAGSLTVLDAVGHGRVVRLRGTAASDVRACKDFTTIEKGIFSASVLIRAEALGTSDVTVTSLREHGNEAASVRLGQGGTFAYYAGIAKIRTSVPWRIGIWYRSIVRVDLARRTYDWTIAVEGATRPLVSARGVPFREPGAVSVSTICVQTSSGAAALDLLLDRVQVNG